MDRDLFTPLLFVGLISYWTTSLLWKERRNLSFIWQVWKRVRPLMLLEVPLMFTGTILLYVMLAQAFPVLNWGWANLFFPDGGNIAITPLLPSEKPSQRNTPRDFGEKSAFMAPQGDRPESAQMPVETRTKTAGEYALLIGRSYLLLSLLLIFPFAAKREEDAYRRGHTEWRPILKQSIKFGFVHLWMGIPIVAGAALIFPGLWFAWKYRRAFNKLKKIMPWKKAQDEAVLRVTALHTLYNTAIGILLAFILFG